MEVRSLFIFILTFCIVYIYITFVITCISQLKNLIKLKLGKDIFKRIMFWIMGMRGECILLSLYHSEFSIFSPKTMCIEKNLRQLKWKYLTFQK